MKLPTKDCEIVRLCVIICVVVNWKYCVVKNIFLSQKLFMINYGDQTFLWSQSHWSIESNKKNCMKNERFSFFFAKYCRLAIDLRCFVNNKAIDLRCFAFGVITKARNIVILIFSHIISNSGHSHSHAIWIQNGTTCIQQHPSPTKEKNQFWLFALYGNREFWTIWEMLIFHR